MFDMYVSSSLALYNNVGLQVKKKSPFAFNSSKGKKKKLHSICQDVEVEFGQMILLCKMGFFHILYFSILSLQNIINCLFPQNVHYCTYFAQL